MSVKALSETIKAMMAAGCTHEQIAAVLDVHANADEEVKNKKREKWKNDKRRQRMSTNVHQDTSGHEWTQVDKVDLSFPLMVSPPPLYNNNYTPPSLKPLSLDTARQARGIRLPDDWKPKEYEDQTEELAKFRDYWIAQPGVKGRKVDWDATWRNWIRNAKPASAASVRKERDLRNISDNLLTNEQYMRKRMQLKEWK